MANAQIAQAFNEIAELLELKGENPFRIRAYRRAALNIEGMAQDLAALSEAELAALPGIGKDLAAKIRQHVATGRIDLHEELKKEIPAGLLDILHVPGVGPKTAKMLFEKRARAEYLSALRARVLAAASRHGLDGRVTVCF